MKRTIFILLAFLVFTSTGLNAQNKTLKKFIELKMPKTKDDELCGTRGAAVCWNPANQKYYAAFAGNAGFPMGVFNAMGKLLSDKDLTTLQDIRGLWYNGKSKKICGNTYNDNGWFSYKLDARGIPTDFTTDFTGMNQPDEQSIGAYNPLAGSVMFLNKSAVVFYDVKTATSGKTLSIHWGRKKADGPGVDESDENANEDYNSTVVYTGIKGSELGFLNTAMKQIDLYNISDGYLTRSVILPEDAVMNATFNFSYTNGIYWLFEIENRKWVGYK